MSDFTYQEKVLGKLETYEWDNVWWEQTNNPADRILYIGDSISCGIRRICTEIANGEYLFDGFGTSKAIDNPYFTESLKIFAMQQGKRKAIIFNNGLHGWHLNDEDYEKNLRKVLGFIENEIPSRQLIILLTTDVANKERHEKVLSRNEIAKRVANDMELPVIDLFTPSQKYFGHICSDGVHFDNDGCKLLAESLVNDLKDILK